MNRLDIRFEIQIANSRNHTSKICEVQGTCVVELGQLDPVGFTTDLDKEINCLFGNVPSGSHERDCKHYSYSRQRERIVSGGCTYCTCSFD